MRAQHAFDAREDGGQLAGVVVAQADGLVDAPVLHPRRVFDRDRGEDGVGDVERPAIEGADARLAPADLFDRAFDFAVGRADPVADRERPVEIDHQAAEEVGQQIPGGEADRDAAHAADREHAGDAHAQRLQDDQAADDQHRHTQQLGDRVHGRPVVGLARILVFGGHALFALVDEAHQEPRQQGDHEHHAERAGRREQRQAAGLVRNLQRDAHTDDQHPEGQRAAQRLNDRVVPVVMRIQRLDVQTVEDAPQDEVQQQCDPDDAGGEQRPRRGAARLAHQQRQGLAE